MIQRVFIDKYPILDERWCSLAINVLLVDGDRQFSSLASRMLEEEGLNVSRAGNCEDAIKILGESNIDCVVTEYELPDCKGLEICRRLNRNGGLPLILFTSYRDSDLLQQAFENGVNDYVSKDLGDYKFSVLADRIRKVVESDKNGFSSKLDPELSIEEGEFLRNVVDVLPIGVIVRDSKDNIVMANEYLTTEAVSLDDIIGVNLDETDLTDEQIERIKKSDEEVLDNWEPQTVEESVVDTQGKKRYIETTKIPFNAGDDNDPHLVSVFRDITFRKKKEKSLEKVIEVNEKMSGASSKEELLKIAIDAVSDIFRLPLAAAFERDGDKLLPVSANFDFKQIFGGEIVLDLDNSVAGTVFESGQSKLIEDMEGTEAFNPDTPIEAEVIIPLGDYGVLISGSREKREFDKADQYIADWFGSSVEASINRVERERKISERDERLEKKDEQIDQFVEMLSHDLRNPLNIAQGYLDMIEGSEESEQVDKALERMEEIIETMLNMAQHTGEIGRENVSLIEVAKEAWKYDYLDEAELVVEDDVELMANRDQLKHLLENLFSNSVKYAGNEVEVTVGSSENGFYVEDNGPGIPQEDRNKVFEFGYSSGDSTGMGLAIVDRIAGFQGWEIEISESDSGGARFDFVY